MPKLIFSDRLLLTDRQVGSRWIKSAKTKFPKKKNKNKNN